MDLDLESKTVDLIEVVSSEKRLMTFVGLAEGYSREEIAGQWKITSEALQPYINEFKDVGLIEVHGKEYAVTPLGQRFLEQIRALDEVVGGSLLEKKVASLLDVGLSYENIVDSLTDQDYSQEEILKAIISTTDEDLTLSELESQL